VPLLLLLVILMALCDDDIRTTDATHRKLLSHYYDAVPLLPTKFLLMHQNVRSIKSDSTKLALLQQLMYETRCDAFAVTETWLKDPEAASIYVPGYNFVYRGESSKTKGFGIGCFLHEKYCFDVLSSITFSLSEMKPSLWNFFLSMYDVTLLTKYF
jgi:hypothetical protein